MIFDEKGKELQAPLAKPEEIYLLKESDKSSTTKLPEIVPPGYLGRNEELKKYTRQELRLVSAFTRQVSFTVEFPFFS